MTHYAILANPGHNRVYFEQSKKLALSELGIALDRINLGCFDLKTSTIAGIFYITFSSTQPLVNENISTLSKLSFVYAIFERTATSEKTTLTPIAKNFDTFLDDDISMILKYSGKTNELFTRMMINVALLSSDFSEADTINLLDPVAGKGTTLYEGLVLGYNVYGIEITTKVVNESNHFLKRYLETKKYKHASGQMKYPSESKDYAKIKYTFDIAKTKKDMKEKNIKHCEFISANAAFTNKLFKKKFFNIIVGDLPYGIQHGNISGGKKKSSLTRNPTELVSACVSSWNSVLKNGGTIVLAWNEFTLPMSEMAKIFKDHGLFVFENDYYANFAHKVDNSILRNIIVAKKI